MTKALLIAFVLAAANFVGAEESTANKINDKLNKTGDKIEAAFDKDKPENKATSEQINDDLNKTGDKIEGTFNKGANKTKKASRRAKDEICEMVNGKMKCVKQKMKHSMKNTEDKINTEEKR